MWLPLALFFGGLLFVGGPYIAWKSRNRRPRADAWKRWAASRGYAFRPYDGAFRRRDGESVSGSSAGVSFDLRLGRSGGADDRHVVARLSANGRALTTTPLELHRNALVGHFSRQVLRSWIEFPAGAFRERWLVRGKQPGEAYALLDAECQQRLVDCDALEFVRIDGDRVELYFDQQVPSQAALDRGVEALCGLFAGFGERKAAG